MRLVIGTVLILLIVAGCSAPEQNPYTPGTPDYALWERQEQLEDELWHMEFQQSMERMRSNPDRR